MDKVTFRAKCDEILSEVDRKIEEKSAVYGVDHDALFSIYEISNRVNLNERKVIEVLIAKHEIVLDKGKVSQAELMDRFCDVLIYHILCFLIQLDQSERKI